MSRRLVCLVMFLVVSRALVQAWMFTILRQSNLRLAARGENLGARATDYRRRGGRPAARSSTPAVDARDQRQVGRPATLAICPTGNIREDIRITRPRTHSDYRDRRIRVRSLNAWVSWESSRSQRSVATRPIKPSVMTRSNDAGATGLVR